MKRFLLSILCLMVAVPLVQAQEQQRPDWQYGLHIGANYNLSGVGYADWLRTPERPVGSFIPYVRNDGSGLGLYLGLNAQYNIFDWLGLQGRLSYDMRSLTAVDDQTYAKPDNTFFEDEFDFNLGLLNLEVLAKLYTGDNLHLTGGAGLGYKIASSFSYRLDSQDPPSDDIDIPGSDLVGSFIGGVGYDIYISDKADDPQWVITPFLEATYMVGMREVEFDNQSGFADGLSVITFRGGVGISLGSTGKGSDMGAMPNNLFQITPPKDGIHTGRTTNEYFPIRPFVIFDSGSTDIPKEWNGAPRYALIENSDRDEWIEMAQYTVMDAEHVTDANANRYMQGEVYYNILNVTGYRMEQTPSARLTLIGSDPVEKNGAELAEAVKKYLVESWNIDPNRIETKGQVEPRKPSGSPRTPAADRPLAAAENRRVELVSNDPSILRRAVIKVKRTAKEENEIHIGLITTEDIASWQVEIRGEGQSRSFGPFTDREAYMDPTGLLPDGETDGEYKATVVAKTADGRTLSEDATFALRLNENDATGERFALIFDFSEEDPEKLSEDFLKEVAPRVPNGATVLVSGFTDNIGNDDYNMKLSKERAQQAAKILKRNLDRLGKKATIRAIGYGETSDRHPYTNVRPEGRMYNRTVIVDIIP